MSRCGQGSACMADGNADSDHAGGLRPLQGAPRRWSGPRQTPAVHRTAGATPRVGSGRAVRPACAAPRPARGARPALAAGRPAVADPGQPHGHQHCSPQSWPQCVQSSVAHQVRMRLGAGPGHELRATVGEVDDPAIGALVEEAATQLGGVDPLVAEHVDGSGSVGTLAGTDLSLRHGPRVAAAVAALRRLAGRVPGGNLLGRRGCEPWLRAVEWGVNRVFLVWRGAIERIGGPLCTVASRPGPLPGSACEMSPRLRELRPLSAMVAASRRGSLDRPGRTSWGGAAGARPHWSQHPRRTTPAFTARNRGRRSSGRDRECHSTCSIDPSAAAARLINRCAMS